MNGQSSPPLVIIGAGGHGRVVAALALRCGRVVKGFLDDTSEAKVDGFSVLGGDEYLDSTHTLDSHFAVGLGARSSWKRRREICRFISSRGFVAPQLIDPDASLAASVRLGFGTQVLMGSRVQHGASIGDWCIVNTATVVEHDCRIGANAHVAPGAVLCGGVTVGEGAFIGAGSVIKEGVTIGSHATVGLGAVVISHVPEGQTVVGVPARGINVK